uniref:DUF2428 domain-containing protein n=1 Tax=Angiostrongylus cantonensis TaxID=6313 RepID=A0A0K0CZ08_ANGCA
MEAEVSQVLLVCCWRAHKHVSTILGLLVTKLCPLGVLTSKDVDRIGAYYWLQLTECKHCGAFETAVEGFPSLHGYLYKQLCTCRDEFSIYPVLIFLTHLFPSNTDVTAVIEKGRNSKSVQSFPLAPFIPALLRVLLWCRAEKLRTLAAAAVVAVSRLKDISFILDWISTSNLKNVRENHVHAVLLLMSSILETNICAEVKERVRRILVNLNQLELWLKWPNTISRARRVLAFISNEKTTSDDELEWMNLCVSVDEEISKRIALLVGAHRLKHGIDEGVIARMVAFLQDDDISIREEVSCHINFSSALGFFDFITDRIKDQYSIESCSVLSADYGSDTFFKGKSNEIRGLC